MVPGSGASRSKPTSQACRSQPCPVSPMLVLQQRGHPWWYHSPPHPLSHRLRHQCTTCIPAKASRSSMQKEKHAQSSTFTVPLKPWSWLPSCPASHSTPTAWIYLALAPWLVSTMHVLAFWSSRHGSRPAKQATATHLMGYPILMWPDPVWTATKPSWDILPSNVRMSGPLSPSQIHLRSLHHSSTCQLQWTHNPIKFSSRSTPCAGSTQTTLAVSLSRRALATNM